MVLLEEEQAERKSLRKPRSQSRNLSFSDGSLQLNTRLPFLYGTMPQPFASVVLEKVVRKREILSLNGPLLPWQVAASAWCTSPRCRGSP